jgi:DnaJ-class molecular chaperone
MIENHYNTLNIKNNSSLEDIKKAYKILVKSSHPDKGGDAKSFIKIQVAYQFLINEDNKNKLDNQIEIEEQIFDKSEFLEYNEYKCINGYIQFDCTQCFSNNYIELNRNIIKANYNTNHLYLIGCSSCSVKYKFNNII